MPIVPVADASDTSDVPARRTAEPGPGTWRPGESPPEPTPLRRRRSKWDPTIELLRTRPGVWRTFQGQSRSSVTNLRRRYPEIEVRGVKHYTDAAGSRRCELWLRYPNEAAT